MVSGEAVAEENLAGSQLEDPINQKRQFQLNELLQRYEVIFKEVDSLPPVRNQDHRIVLKDGTDPISVRPYRYPSFQKNVMEELIKEMLDKGLIRPSTSPFSAPVVLVKKRIIVGDYVLIIEPLMKKQ